MSINDHLKNMLDSAWARSPLGVLVVMFILGVLTLYTLTKEIRAVAYPQAQGQMLPPVRQWNPRWGPFPCIVGQQLFVHGRCINKPRPIHFIADKPTTPQSGDFDGYAPNACTWIWHTKGLVLDLRRLFGCPPEYLGDTYSFNGDDYSIDGDSYSVDGMIQGGGSDERNRRQR